VPRIIAAGGRDQIAAFFAAVPAGGRLDLIKLTQTRANGQPAFAAYLSDHLGRCQGYGIMVLTVIGGMLSAITGFLGSGMFRHFGLPQTWDAARVHLHNG
jgi:RNA polymerase sigma-70 factor (ECF subfamily)